MDLVSMLESLTAPVGVSGSERLAADVAIDQLRSLTDLVTKDARGTVIGTLNGIGPKVLLDAHLDQVGFIVTELCEGGFLKFDKCGGTDPRIMSGLEVVVLGKARVYGVITSIPPHLSDAKDEGKAKKATELAIDTGLTKEECEKLINKGDRVVMKGGLKKLLGNEVTSPALDDRAGMAVHLRVLQLVQEAVAAGAPKPNLTVQFSVQEEVGGKAAATAAYGSGADMAIAVDVSFAETPGCEKPDCGTIGAGPMVGVAPVLDYNMTEAMKAIALEKNIPYQIEVMTRRTGTHADEIAITKNGIPTALVSIPLKYMHTPVEVVNTEDLEQCAQLIAAFILALSQHAEGGKN